MAFALLDNGQIGTYPLNVRAYLHDNNISAAPGRYKELNIYEVKTDAYPEFNKYTEKVTANAPVYDAVNDEVTQSWSVVAMSADERSEFDANWTLEAWRVLWAFKKHHWDRDFWGPVEVHLQSLHTAGSDSDYADFATLLERTIITWTAFVGAWQVIQSNAQQAGVTVTVPTLATVRAAWQEAETHTPQF